MDCIKRSSKLGVNSWLGEQEVVPHNINFVIVVCVYWCILCSCSAYDVHLGHVSNISQQPKHFKRTIWPSFYLTCFSLATFYLFFRLILVKWFCDFCDDYVSWCIFMEITLINMNQTWQSLSEGPPFLKYTVRYLFVMYKDSCILVKIKLL